MKVIVELSVNVGVLTVNIPYCVTLTGSKTKYEYMCISVHYRVCFYYSGIS